MGDGESLNDEDDDDDGDDKAEFRMQSNCAKRERIGVVIIQKVATAQRPSESTKGRPSVFRKSHFWAETRERPGRGIFFSLAFCLALA